MVLVLVVVGNEVVVVSVLVEVEVVELVLLVVRTTGPRHLNSRPSTITLPLATDSTVTMAGDSRLKENSPST